MPYRDRQISECQFSSSSPQHTQQTGCVHAWVTAEAIHSAAALGVWTSRDSLGSRSNAAVRLWGQLDKCKKQLSYKQVEKAKGRSGRFSSVVCRKKRCGLTALFPKVCCQCQLETWTCCSSTSGSDSRGRQEESCSESGPQRILLFIITTERSPVLTYHQTVNKYTFLLWAPTAFLDVSPWDWTH